MPTKLRGTIPTMLSPTQAAYIAGILDGEGSITISHKKGGKTGKRGSCFRLLVEVRMCDQKTIDWLAETVGVGNVRYGQPTRKQHRPHYRWQLWSGKASNLLKQALPYLVTKRMQAILAVAFQDAKRDGVGRDGLSEIEWMEQVEAHATMRRLNRRGVCQG